MTIIDPASAYDINLQVSRILRELGNPEPPLSLEDVMELLSLDFNYYGKVDLSIFDQIAHKVRVAGIQVIREPGRLVEVIKKAKLSALWLPKSRQIFLDEEVPKPKQRHLQAHEIAHSIIPWHRSFLFGDNELTLTPMCHDIIESEANFGAGQLLFLGSRFVHEANDFGLDWTGIQAIQRRFRNTLTTTLWHVVEELDPSLPMIGLISRHPKKPSIGGGIDGSPVKHFISSAAFRTRFPSYDRDSIYSMICEYVSYRTRGPCGTNEFVLVDRDGNSFNFLFDSFCNTYDLLTFAKCLGPTKAIYAPGLRFSLSV